MLSDETFLQRALVLAEQSIAAGGGPFGALIVKAGTIIAEGSNQVTKLWDPTAHAEVVAIRGACASLERFSLDGCVLYASCEPCPMCLGAIYWARLDRLVFAVDRDAAAKIGFDDRHIYDEISLPLDKRALPMRQLMLKDALRPFEAWQRKTDKTPY